MALLGTATVILRGTGCVSPGVLYNNLKGGEEKLRPVLNSASMDFLRFSRSCLLKVAGVIVRGPSITFKYVE